MINENKNTNQRGNNNNSFIFIKCINLSLTALNFGPLTFLAGTGHVNIHCRYLIKIGKFVFVSVFLCALGFYAREKYI